ncbi:LPS-assembly protein LptD [Sphingosinicella sp. LHD-64]|uniref:LPS-assembly protein LptD n=1 Tax=Sphingosinicella sp. LHD-64 TaxID=3072139 RepID=UPI0035BE1190
MTTLRTICRTALPLLLSLPCAALAQTPVAPADQAPDQVAFSADQLAYDENTEIVTATGEVRMTREGYNLRADTLNWNRITGEVRAEGNVRVVSPAGDVAYGDSVQLQDTLRDGVIQNLLLVLADGGRLAAIEARRDNGVTTLNQAAYTPCSVVDENGCPKAPTWQITAVRVVHDPVRHRISYRGATLNLFGRPIIGLPGLSHPDGSDGAGGSGVLVPELRYDRINGFEIAVPYYLRLAENRDLTLTPHVYTDVAPMLEAEYRQLTARGAFQIRGYATYSRRVGVNEEPLPGADRAFRGYIEGNGRWQLTPEWSVTASGRYVTDRTFLRRYDISRDDRLRSVIEVERIGADSYISIAGWAFQGLRVTDVEGQQPIVLPAIDARFRLDDPWLGGTFNLQANSLAILRTEGQDTQRAFASAQWDRRMITPWGQELVLTAFARGDVYHASDTLLTQPLYRGTEGWSGRVIGALAADIKWPFIGEFLGGTQRLTPRVQFVAAPVSDNLDIPNEDARAIELEDSNLFALNRFPGYDRWEDGARVTYGADWAFDLPGIRVRTNVGQSYRLSTREAILPPGTGLSGRFSDIVGRTSIQVGRRLSFTHRFRLDKDSFAVRRNEIDATVGGRQTYATIGYLRLNRNVDPSIEDLRDREEVRVGGRVAFARYWSIFGSAVVDLTDRREDPLSQSDGFDPIRHRIGILYDDECLELGVTWRRDYETTGDARRGNTFLIRVALKNLGR